MTARRLALPLVLLLVAAGAAGASSTADDAVIAYEGAGKIYLIHADGTARQELATGATDRALAWSHDGALIAYTAGPATAHGPDVHTEIRIVNADGTGLRRLTRGPSGTARNPTWSPDDRRIAFDAWNARDERFALYTIGADGSGLRVLTPRPRDGASYMNADWSPNGRWIAFERIGGSARHDLMEIRPNGTGLHRVASSIAGPQCICPDWSPDGSKIAYQASTSLATQSFPEIFVMNANGTGRKRLTRDPSRDENPDWSPDGTRIAFYSERYSRAGAEIMVMDAADGGDVVRVTRDPWYSSLPRWQPTP